MSPAYAEPLRRQCTDPGCEHQATHMVRNRRGEDVRPCCGPHARTLVAFLNDASIEKLPTALVGTPPPTVESEPR